MWALGAQLWSYTRAARALDHYPVLHCVILAKLWSSQFKDYHRCTYSKEISLKNLMIYRDSQEKKHEMIRRHLQPCTGLSSGSSPEEGRRDCMSQGGQGHDGGTKGTGDLSSWEHMGSGPTVRELAWTRPRPSACVRQLCSLLCL